MTLLNWRARFGLGWGEPAAAVRDAVRSSPPVGVGTCGPGLAGQSVYAKVFSLLRLRLRLARALGWPPAGLHGHEPALALLPVGLLNLVGFTERPGAEMKRAVDAASRGLRLGALALDTIEVLVTNRAVSPEQTTCLGRASLCGL